MPLKVGLIGFGLAGRYFHAPLLKAAGFDIVAVVSSRAAEIRTLLPGAEVLESDGALFARADVQLIVVATPTPLHAAQIRAALQADNHVIVDKPICATSADARDLARLARNRNRVLAVFHNRRWDNDFLTLQRLISEGKLGEINGFHMRWDRFRPEPPNTWRNAPDPASSMLYDLGSHMIDQALVLFGRPDWLQADVFTQRPGAQTEDGFEILMGKGTLRMTLGVSYLASDSGWRYRVHGARASFVKAELDPQEAQARAGIQPDDPRFGVEPPEHWATLVHGTSGERESIPSERGRWLTFYEQARHSIEQGAPVPVSADEAAQVIELIEAAYESSRTGKRISLLGSG